MKPEGDILDIYFCAYKVLISSVERERTTIVHRYYAHWENTHIVYYTRYR